MNVGPPWTLSLKGGNHDCSERLSRVFTYARSFKFQSLSVSKCMYTVSSHCIKGINLYKPGRSVTESVTHAIAPLPSGLETRRKQDVPPIPFIISAPTPQSSCDCTIKALVCTYRLIKKFEITRYPNKVCLTVEANRYCWSKSYNTLTVLTKVV